MWQEVENHKGRYSVWIAPERSDATVEVLLPLSRELRDYVNRVAEILQTLEVYEQRSQLEIVEDIRGTSTDVIRLGAEGDQFEDGTLPIEQGIEFLQAGRELLLAAACSAAQPREVYLARKPRQAENYIKSVRLGQSEHGSYVFAIHSPIAPPRSPLLVTPADEPFARVVTRTLMRATGVVRDTAERAEKRGLEGFMPAVNAGVSANLCDALVKLQEGTGADAIRLQMSWAVSGYQPPDVAARIVIPSTLVPIIREAGTFLRTSGGQSDYTIQGTITHLQQLRQDRGGRVRILADIPVGRRHVQVDLSAEDYTTAIDAHQHHWQVSCTGFLTREGRSWILRDYNVFHITHLMF